VWCHISTMTCVTVHRFRWVACQLDELKKCTKRRKTLDYILESLPATLEGTYDQILSRIPPADASGAAKLLLWLAFANQPLHIDYLGVIVEFDMDKRDFDADGRLSSSEDVLKICSSLVTRMNDNTVQLAHASVKTYVLEKKRTIQSNIIMDPSIGDKFMGQCCLSYLLHTRENLLEKDSPSIWKSYQGSLIRYAAMHWARHHLRSRESWNVDDLQQMKNLFVQDSFAFQNWIKVYNFEADPFPTRQMKGQSLLWCSALHGITSIVEWQLPSVIVMITSISTYNAYTQ
jgi:hypothetical protein